MVHGMGARIGCSTSLGTSSSSSMRPVGPASDAFGGEGRRSDLPVRCG